MKKKIKYIVFLIIILILILSLKIKNDNTTDFKLTYVKTCIDDRICIYKKDGMFVGNSNKELENGYYDIQIENIEKQNGIKVHVNKLWKTIFPDKLFEDEYAKEVNQYLFNLLLKRCNIEFSDDFKEEFIKDMIEGYIAAKENSNYIKSFEKQKVSFKLYSQEGELIIEVSMK